MGPEATAAAFVATAMVSLWLLSLRLKNSSIVDIFWGLGFVGVAWLVAPWPVAALISVWGVRLATHLFLRNRGKPEDPRYAAMRASHGATWGWRSLFIVFGLQGALMLVISLPLRWAALNPVGIALVCGGIAIEAVADAQLRAHRARAPGTLMTSGLWSWSRHPNYFGDCVVWWGVYALAAQHAWWTVISPLLMTVLLTKVSGVPMLERSMSKREGWAEYARRTSAFFPRPPKA